MSVSLKIKNCITYGLLYCVGVGIPSYIDLHDWCRFWSRVDKGPHPRGCWLWTASIRNLTPDRSDGYGQFIYQGRNWGAHQFAYYAAYGLYDRDLGVLHTCDVRRCIRPSHLYLGTQVDNSRDMMDRHRNASAIYPGWADWARGKNHWSGRYPDRVQKGSQCGRAKLSEQDVRDIRRRNSAGETKVDLAKEYDVAESLVYVIVYRKIWRHI
jgi:hypothetical protein